MNINCNYKPFTKYVLLICLAFLCSTNQLYSQTNSDDSYDLESAINNHNKVFLERKDANSSVVLKKIEPWTFSGSVISVVNENNIIVKHNDREIMLRFIKNEASEFNVGDSVTVTCIPYRENPNKVIMAKGVEIKKSDGEINSQTNTEANKELESLPKEKIKRNNSERATRVKRTLTSFKMFKTCTISGEIIEVISDNDVMIRYEGREILVKFRGSEAADFEVGDTVSVTCTPLREDANGVILAKGTKISKMQ